MSSIEIVSSSRASDVFNEIMNNSYDEEIKLLSKKINFIDDGKSDRTATLGKRRLDMTEEDMGELKRAKMSYISKNVSISHGKQSMRFTCQNGHNFYLTTQ